MTNEDRYLNLALINIGEAVAYISNKRNSGGTVGMDMERPKASLLKAIAALDGQNYVESVDPKHHDASRVIPGVSSGV
jgi:hypothetical protein